MFYIKFGLKKHENDMPRPADGSVRFVGIPEDFVGKDCYFRIYEDGRPLNGLSYASEKDARKKLRGLMEELQQASNGWYRVEYRHSPYLTIRNILGIRKVYGDGSTVNVTYVIRKIRMNYR